MGKRAIDSYSLAQMRERGGRWAAYQNVDMEHSDRGRIQFVKYGPGCTLTLAPHLAPDTESCGFGWRYHRIGFVELVSGNILDHEPDPLN